MKGKNCAKTAEGGLTCQWLALQGQNKADSVVEPALLRGGIEQGEFTSRVLS